jgi:hypothetical protein
MTRFDYLSLLPTDITTKIGEKLDADIKKILHEKVDEMLLQSWSPLYDATQEKCLEILHILINEAPFIWTDIINGDIEIEISLVPDDNEKLLTLQYPFSKAIRSRSKDGFSKDERKIFIKALRDLAETLESEAANDE